MILTDDYFMNIALSEAAAAEREGEVPIGAVIECEGRVLARTHNLTERLNDVTAHAEMLAITAAAEALGGKYLDRCTLYVTVEPCVMCAGALGWSHIGKVVFGAPDDKRGYRKFCNHSPFHPKTIVSGGVRANEASEIITDFFKSKRR